MLSKVILILIISTVCVLGFNPYKKIVSRHVSGDCGDPVFLTEYIEKQDIKGGRRAASVAPFLKDIESYAGFFTVNKEYNSNIYFWFFPAEKYKEHAPLVVWLQGGPGASSLFGLFSENGPYYLDLNNTLGMREHYWSQIANVIYIDNPVGTGFSFTENKAGYVTDQAGVGNDLYQAITQFFTVFPEYLSNNFYVFGESYGGKYAPAMAYTIHKNNMVNDMKIKLKGVGIGNGFTDPPNMMVYSEYLNEIGLIDDNGKKRFEDAEKNLVAAVQKGDYASAGKMFNELANGGKQSLLYNETGFTSHFNYLHYKDESTDGDLGKFFDNSRVRKNLHVGKLSFSDGSEQVETNLEADLMKSVIPWFKVLVENYNVLVYNGQLDIICAYPLTVNYLKKLEWSGSEEYKKAAREKWYVKNELAGYVKKVKGLTEVIVRNSGHMVPQDQPIWALTLFQNFVYNKPF